MLAIQHSSNVPDSTRRFIISLPKISYEELLGVFIIFCAFGLDCQNTSSWKSSINEINVFRELINPASVERPLNPQISFDISLFLNNSPDVEVRYSDKYSSIDRAQIKITNWLPSPNGGNRDLDIPPSTSVSRSSISLRLPRLGEIFSLLMGRWGSAAIQSMFERQYDVRNTN